MEKTESLDGLKMSVLAVLAAAVSIAAVVLGRANAESALKWDQAAVSSCASTTDAYRPDTGRLIVRGVWLTSATAGGFMVLRDSNTANITSPALRQVFFGTTTVSGSTEFGRQVTFDPPLRIYNGLSVNMTNCPTLSNGLQCGGVLYNRVDD